MLLVRPSFEIIDPQEKVDGIHLLRTIEMHARVSHRSEDKTTPDSWERFIKAVVIDKGDWSVAEHASACVRIRTDRGITHELVRHRLFSFTQESTRFVNYGKKEIEFIEPTWSYTDKPNPRFEWEAALLAAEDAYLDLLKNGQPPQAARSVLPNALASTIVMTGNLRSWRHFFTMRTTKESHPDMRLITIPMLEKFKELIPLLYDDIEPNQKQSISLSKRK